LINHLQAAEAAPTDCSHRAAGAELVGFASSDSRAGKPRPLLLGGSERAFSKHQAFAEAEGDD